MTGKRHQPKSVLDLLRERLGGNTARSQQSAHPRDPVVAEWWGGAATASGERVTPDRAMSSIWVWACVVTLAETLASVPWVVYRRAGGGDRDRDVNHPLWTVLHDQPNEWQTAFEFKEMLMGHVALRGNAYAEIMPGKGRAVDQLIPLHPDRVRVFRAPDKRLAYRYEPADGPRRVLLQHEMFHVRGLSLDGMTGMGPIAAHRETVGEDFAAQDYGARFWANDATPRGVLMMENHFDTDEEMADFRKSWQDAQSGRHRHKVAVLEDGVQYKEIGMNHADAQFIEDRKFTGAQIARIFRVPPHIIGIMDQATFSNIEHQSIEFVKYTMMPWFVRFEQAAHRDLLTPESRRTHFTEFLADALMRGDSKARAEVYKSGIVNGWLTRNEARRRENLNGLDGLDEPLVPMNMTLADILEQTVKEKLDDQGQS